jgi:CRISPR-associated protein Cmr3
VSLFQIEPRDPLCFTDGRGTQGAALRTLSFPWPSTLAGLVRARAGSDRDGRFIHRRLDDLRRVGVRGP